MDPPAMRRSGEWIGRWTCSLWKESRLRFRCIGRFSAVRNSKKATSIRSCSSICRTIAPVPSKWHDALPRLYAIADASFGDPVEIVQALIHCGVRLVQVRNKNAGMRVLLDQVERILAFAP